jgi:hypothetical protein
MWTFLSCSMSGLLLLESTCCSALWLNRSCGPSLFLSVRTLLPLLLAVVVMAAVAAALPLLLPPQTPDTRTHVRYARVCCLHRGVPSAGRTGTAQPKQPLTQRHKHTTRTASCC